MKAENIARNRKIKADRVYKTLGRMTWWRIVLGVLLLIFVFFLSGTVSQRLAAKGRFNDAERLMVSPKWMENYRPEVKAYIEAGVLYENGDYEAAYKSFSLLEASDEVRAMKSACALRLASAAVEAEDCDKALAYFSGIDGPTLTEEDAAAFELLRTALIDYYTEADNSFALGKLQGDED